MQILVVENFGRIYLSQPKFPCQIFMYTIPNKPFVLDLPNFSPPIACLAINRQKLTPPKVLHYTVFEIQENLTLKVLWIQITIKLVLKFCQPGFNSVA